VDVGREIMKFTIGEERGHKSGIVPASGVEKGEMEGARELFCFNLGEMGMVPMGWARMGVVPMGWARVTDRFICPCT
jgi:hypothetical protein